MALYRVLDVFFFVFHSALILFILFGWIWRRTRRANLVVILVTAFSWCILGIWFGLGYCPCTHWHWLVREKLGDYDMPTSYIKFLIDRLTGGNVNAVLIDVVTGVAFIVAFLASVYINRRDAKARQEDKSD